MKAREVKRAKLVARYAEKRAALKQIVRTGEPADAFEAAQKLQELPKNSNPIRMHNRCKLTVQDKSTRTKKHLRDIPDPMLSVQLVFLSQVNILKLVFV